MNSVIRCLTDDSVRADINSVDYMGATALAHAVWRGAELCTTALLNARADPNIPLNDGRTPLHLAAYYNRLPELRRLLTAPGIRMSSLNVRPRPHAGSAGPNAPAAGVEESQTVFGTPLHFAAEKNRGPALEALVTAGAAFSAANFWGQTPLHIAIRACDARALRLLVAAVYAKTTPSPDAATALAAALASARFKESQPCTDEGDPSIPQLQVSLPLAALMRSFNVARPPAVEPAPEPTAEALTGLDALEGNSPRSD
jgi:ankyrin repeat protein